MSAKPSKTRRAIRTRKEHFAEFNISTDKRRLDRELIHRFLTNCYWAKGIPRKIVDRSIENSLCFGVYHSGQQVGFARVISDFATYAYIGDVFVVDSFRGQGLGKLLMKSIMQYPDLQGLRRWSLVTRDAQGLYAQFGFKTVKSPERHMEVLTARFITGSKHSTELSTPSLEGIPDGAMGEWTCEGSFASLRMTVGRE